MNKKMRGQKHTRKYIYKGLGNLHMYNQCVPTSISKNSTLS